MHFGAEEVQQLVESIWSNVLGWEVSPDAEPMAGTLEDFPTRCVSISGAWNGAVLLGCHIELARRAAGTMFGLAPEAASPEDIGDALGELTNMLGGNLKSLFSGPCRLGLPTGGNTADETVPGLQVGFHCQGLPLRVSVRECRVAQERTVRIDSALV